MKRSVLVSLFALVAIVIVGYPVATWFIGNQIEETLDEEYKNLNGLLPFMKLSDRKYERGLFTSVETATATLTLPPLQPIQFTVRSKVRHGPLPGMTTLAAATIDTEVGVNDGFKQDVAEWIGDKNLLTMHTIYRLDGSGGDSTVNMPGFSTPRISWDGMSLRLGFTKGLASYSVHGEVPKLAISDTGGTLLHMAGINFNSEQKRVFDDDPLLFDGTNKLTIAEFELDSAAHGSSPVLPTSLVMKQFAAEGIAALNNGEFIDYDSKLGAETLKVDNQDFGPAHFESAFQHLHARTVANLNRAYLENVDKSASHSLNVAEFASTFFGVSQELIKHNAEFRLNRLSFTRPQGEAVLSASVKFSDVTSSDFVNRQALLSKLYTSIDLKIPEGLLPQLLQARFASIEQAEERIRAGVASLVAQGYATEESGIIKTKLEFRDGQQWLNGKQYVQPVTAMLSPFPVTPPSASSIGMPDSARRFNCNACHSIDRKIVGPSWMEVSRRYQGISAFDYQGKQYPIEDGLLMKVSKGGAGHWGPMPMPAIDPTGRSQSDIRALIRFILSLAKTDAPQYKQTEVVPPYELGETLDDFMANAKSRGITPTAVDPHNRSASGENTSVWFASSGVRLFFANEGTRNLKVIRFDPPYPGKLKGVGIGDKLATLNNTFGSPVRPPWSYANNKAYLFNGEGNSYVRFDLNEGVVQTIFVMAK